MQEALKIEHISKFSLIEIVHIFVTILLHQWSM